MYCKYHFLGLVAHMVSYFIHKQFQLSRTLQVNSSSTSSFQKYSVHPRCMKPSAVSSIFAQRVDDAIRHHEPDDCSLAQVMVGHMGSCSDLIVQMSDRNQILHGNTSRLASSSSVRCAMSSSTVCHVKLQPSVHFGTNIRHIRLSSPPAPIIPGRIKTRQSFECTPTSGSACRWSYTSHRRFKSLSCTACLLVQSFRAGHLPPDKLYRFRSFFLHVFIYHRLGCFLFIRDIAACWASSSCPLRMCWSESAPGARHGRRWWWGVRAPNTGIVWWRWHSQTGMEPCFSISTEQPGIFDTMPRWIQTFEVTRNTKSFCFRLRKAIEVYHCSADSSSIRE